MNSRDKTIHIHSNFTIYNHVSKKLYLDVRETTQYFIYCKLTNYNLYCFQEILVVKLPYCFSSWTLVEAPLTIFYYSKHQVYYSKRVVNEVCCVAGFSRFTIVNFAVVSCVGNSGNMKGKFTIVNLSLRFQNRGLSMVYLNFVCFGVKLSCILRSLDP